MTDQLARVSADPRVRWESVAVRFAEWLDLGYPRSDQDELTRRMVKVCAEVGEVAKEAAAENQDREAIAGEAADVVFAALVAAVSLPGYNDCAPVMRWYAPFVPELPRPLAYLPIAVDRQTLRLSAAAGQLAETVVGNQRKGTRHFSVGSRFSLADAHLHLQGVMTAALLLIARTGVDPAWALDRCAAKLVARLDANARE